MTFDDKEKVIFESEELSKVSFMNTDITGVGFSDKARWGGGGKKVKEDRFKIVDERRLEKEIKDKDRGTTGSILGETLKDAIKKEQKRKDHSIVLGILRGGRHTGSGDPSAAIIGIQLSIVDAGRSELMEKEELDHPN
jgi:hypothetical protein